MEETICSDEVVWQNDIFTRECETSIDLNVRVSFLNTFLSSASLDKSPALSSVHVKYKGHHKHYFTEALCDNWCNRNSTDNEVSFIKC